MLQTVPWMAASCAAHLVMAAYLPLPAARSPTSSSWFTCARVVCVCVCACVCVLCVCVCVCACALATECQATGANLAGVPGGFMYRA